MAAFLSEHWWIPYVMMGLQYMLSAIVSSMDMPTTTDSRNYRFWFKLLNYFAANPLRAKAASNPSLADDVIAQKTTTTKTTLVAVPADPEKEK